MAYGDFKALAKRTASYNFLRDKAFSITKNPKYVGSEYDLASMVYNFSDKRTSGSRIKKEIK